MCPSRRPRSRPWGRCTSYATVPIATAISHVLGLAADATIELNLHIRNSAVSEFKVTPERHTLISFNTLPHLDAPDHAGWVTGWVTYP